MYPQQQPQFPPAPQAYPPQAPQAYPPQAPQAYPPQAPQAYPPQAPQAYPPQAPQAYPPQAPQGYPPQGYAPPQAPQGYPQPQAQAPVVAGTLDQFYAQPSTGGGKALSFEQVGTTYTGIVTRPVGNSDIEQQTVPGTNTPATFKDGRPKFVMKVPLQMQPSAAYPDGLALWYCRGSARDELVRAMSEAGAPAGPPEAGSVITVTMVGSRPSGPAMAPTKLFQVQYRRPQGASLAAVSAPAATTPQATAPPTNGYHSEPPPVYAVNSNGNATAPAPTEPVPAPQPVPAPPVPAPPVPQPVPAPPVPQPVPAPPVPQPVAAAPVELSAEQRELLARLTGAAA